MKPKWLYVTHDDVSVRWLKLYYLYSLPEKIIPQEDVQEKTKQVFQYLRRHEVVGKHINSEWYTDIPIIGEPLPTKFNELEHVIKCANFPDSNEANDFDPFTSNLDSTMSQDTGIGTEHQNESDDAVLQFLSENVPATVT